ncbi:beta-lactamase/transpeptidase-like protein [Ilyonectria destructans]|nr:beta-lactamase/transpeptidase-like protein [Ilyonectria destructans]
MPAARGVTNKVGDIRAPARSHSKITRRLELLGITMTAVQLIFEDVTGREDGLPGFQIKSMNSSGAKGRRFLSSNDESEVDGGTVFWVASCTKIVVTIAVMQCVERGLITLDTIPTDILPELKELPLLEGWTSDGKPIISKPKRCPTIREILSHQSGICVDISEPTVTKWLQYTGATSNSQSGNPEDFIYPMVFSPGEGWTYSIGMDWMGLLVSRLNGNETLGKYFEDHIFGPLGLRDTTFEPLTDPGFNFRLTGTHWRQQDGTVKLALENAGNHYANSGYHNGGGGLWSTANDLCKLLHGVFLDKTNSQILRPESVREIFTPCLVTSKHLEERVAKMTAEQDLNILPQIPISCPKNFGLGVALNLEDLETGLSAGSAQWSGFPNCYWWVDLKKGVTGVMVASILNFADRQALRALANFQKLSYGIIPLNGHT